MHSVCAGSAGVVSTNFLACSGCTWHQSFSIVLARGFKQELCIEFQWATMVFNGQRVRERERRFMLFLLPPFSSPQRLSLSFEFCFSLFLAIYLQGAKKM